MDRSLTPTGVNARGPGGKTVLMHAVSAHHVNLPVVDYLLAQGADVNATDKGGWTALHFAARGQNPQIVGLLLAHGAAVDAADAFGNTPLARWITAPYPLDRAVLALLLEHGADPCRKNHLGQSPLDVARTTGHAEIVARTEASKRSGGGGTTGLPTPRRQNPLRERIEGMAQHTGTHGQAFSAYRQAIAMATSGRYERITLNPAYRPDAPERSLPAISARRTTGRCDVVVVPSKMDSELALCRLCEEAMCEIAECDRGSSRAAPIDRSASNLKNVYTSLALYDWDGEIDTVVFHELATAFFKANGVSPNVVSALQANGICANTSHTVMEKRLRSEGLPAADRFALYHTLPRYAQLVFGWDVMAAIDVKRKTMCFSSDERLAGLELDFFEPMLERLSRCVKLGHGIGYRRSFGLGPGLYADGLVAGLAYGDQDMIEADRISAQFREGLAKNRRVAGRLRDVYPLNVLCESHLSQRIDDLPLLDWIQRSAARGALKSLRDAWLWRIPEANIDPVRAELAKGSLLIGR